MKRTFLVGLSAAIIGAIGLFIGDALGMTMNDTIIGVGVGVIAATVHVGTPLQRLIGLLIGLALGVALVLMLGGAIPGGATALGIGVSFAIVLVVIALIHGFTSTRIHAWVMLLGVLAFGASVFPILATNPFALEGLLPATIGSQLAMAMIGFLVVIPATLYPDTTALSVARSQRDNAEPETATEPPTPAVNQTTGGIR